MIINNKRKREKKCIVDTAIPGDIRIHEKEFEKIEKYQGLNWTIKRMWGIQDTDVVPVVVGALIRTAKG